MNKNNLLTLSGNVGSEAIVTKTINGDDFAAISLATQESYFKDSKWQNQLPVWHDLYAFDNNIIAFFKRLKKGERVSVTGKLHYRMVDVGEKKIKEAKIVVLTIKDSPLKSKSVTKEVKPKKVLVKTKKVKTNKTKKAS